MNQSEQRTRLLWSTWAIVLVACFGFGNIVSSQTYVPNTRGNTHTEPAYTYPGPSDDYTTTPHPWSLTYSNTDSNYRVRDVDQDDHWANEAGNDNLTVASKRTRSDDTTRVAK